MSDDYRYYADSVLERLYLEEEQVRIEQRALQGIDRDGIRSLDGRRQNIWAQIRLRKAHLKKW